MARSVKPPSVHRQRQVQLTRSVILDAAARLFVANGFVGTTIERIAAEAGVAASTVYATFSTKVAILAAVRWRWVQAAGILEVRDAIRREADVRRRLALLAGLNRRQYETGLELLDVMRVAAATDSDARSDWEQLISERRANLDAIFPDLDAASRDVVRALLSPDVYVETVERGGWSPDEYERWLGNALARLVEAR